jgi:hypothetical protein
MTTGISVAQQPRRAVDLSQRQPVVVEDVAGQQQDVRPFAASGVQHLAKRVKRLRMTAVDVEVRAVDDREVGHARRF